MDESVAAHLARLYGLGPEATPLALQFPRLPPGLPGPVPARHDELATRYGRLGPNIEDFKDAHRRFAAGLVEPSSSPTIPPGHPLYSRRGSFEQLRSENAKLKLENSDLRRKLDTRSDGRNNH